MALSPGGYAVRKGQRNTQPPRSVNVQVAVRCRPLNERERTQGERGVLQCDPDRKEVVLSSSVLPRKTNNLPTVSPGKKRFTYDHVFSADATQADVYEGVVEPIVEEVLEGYNCTVFAYGQTGTGKTHTMEGRRDDDMIGVSERRLAENAGIIPRAVKQIFDHLRSLTDEHSVRVSQLELYNEQLTDLLTPEHDVCDSLRVYEEPQKGTFVQGLEDVVVRSEDEIFAVLDRSALKRKTAETLMNKYSSRSHSVFSITIHIKQSTAEGTDLLKVGKLNLVDLAGSENVGRSGAVKGRAREAGNINQSLLTLGRVITALVDRHPHVPYRDSKLTRLLQESLGGRNKTCVIATVTPGSSSLEETASTLDYAYRAKSIKNRPIVNQMIAKHVLLKEYTEEISRLKKELDATREKNGVYLPLQEHQRLQSLSSQQKDEIGALESQGEEYEQRLATFKEKLARTADALRRDQNALETSRQTARTLGAQLSKTQKSLAVTNQQRDEYNFLAKSHIATESILHHQGSELQRNLSEYVEKTDLLHERVEVATSLEKENTDNLSALKEAVNEKIIEVSDILNSQKERQTEELLSSRENLEKLSGSLHEGLHSISKEFETVLELMKGQDDKYLESSATKKETFGKEWHDRSAVITKKLQLHTENSAALNETIELAGKKITNGLSTCSSAVINIVECIKKHSSEEVAEFGRFARKQRQALAALHQNVEDSVKLQSKEMEKLRKLQEEDQQIETKDLDMFKSDLLENISNAVNSLLEGRRNRYTERLDTFDAASRGVKEETQSICTTLQASKSAQEERLDEMQKNMKANIDDVKCTMEKIGASHGSSSEVISQSIENVLESCDHAVESARQCKEKVQSQVDESNTAVVNFQKESEEERKVFLESRNSVAVQGRNAMLSENGCIENTMNVSVEQVKNSLVAMGDIGRSLENDVKQKVGAEMRNEVEEHKVLRDEKLKNAPKRVQCPAVFSLARTRNHRELITEFRNANGAQSVALDDLKHGGVATNDREIQETELPDTNISTIRGRLECEKMEESLELSSGASVSGSEGEKTMEGVEVLQSQTSKSSNGQEDANNEANNDANNENWNSANVEIGANRLAAATSKRAKRTIEHLDRKKATGIPIRKGRQYHLRR